MQRLCTALSATIGTGNIVGVATAIGAGGPGALFWMMVAAFFGMATKYSEGLLAVKYRVVAEDGHSLGGPFYYIEKGMGTKWKWLGKDFCFLWCLCRTFWISEHSARLMVFQVQYRASLTRTRHIWYNITIPWENYSWAVVIASLILCNLCGSCI